MIKALAEPIRKTLTISIKRKKTSQMLFINFNWQLAAFIVFNVL